MKRRNRKKAFACSHYGSERVLIDDVPYNMYGVDIYCKLGKFDESKDADMCETCTKFCASRPMIRRKREEDKRIRGLLRRDEKYDNEVLRQGLWEKDKIDSDVIDVPNELIDSEL